VFERIHSLRKNDILFATHQEIEELNELKNNKENMDEIQHDF
jgi:hypothetical protein